MADSRIILGGRADLAGDINQAFTNFRAGQDRRQMAPLVADQVNLQRQDVVNQVQQAKTRSLVDFSNSILPAFEQGDIDGVRNATQVRIQQLDNAGQDSSDSRELLGMIDSNPDLARQRVQRAVELGQRTGLTQGPARDTRTAAEKDFATLQRLRGESPEVAGEFARRAGFDRPSLEQQESSKVRLEQIKSDIKTEGAKELADIAVGKATKETRRKASIVRQQGYIDSGVVAADTLGNINRSLELLNSVKTGGVNSALLSAKRLFGIESADEAELSNSLGIQVLQQLKPLFGSAFTEAEGSRLEKLSAGYGKSVAGNRRILREIQKVTRNAAKRGMRAARAQGDTFAAGEIQAGLDAAVSKTPTDQRTPATQDDVLSQAELDELQQLRAEFGDQ